MNALPAQIRVSFSHGLPSRDDGDPRTLFEPKEIGRGSSAVKQEI
jgi:hypothetical protein